MPSHTARANAKKSAVRAHVEHSFAHQKGPMGLVILTIGIARATAAVMLANMAYNMRRWCWLDGRNLPASRRTAPKAGALPPERSTMRLLRRPIDATSTPTKASDLAENRVAGGLQVAAGRRTHTSSARVSI